LFDDPPFLPPALLGPLILISTHVLLGRFQMRSITQRSVTAATVLLELCATVEAPAMTSSSAPEEASVPRPLRTELRHRVPQAPTPTTLVSCLRPSALAVLQARIAARGLLLLQTVAQVIFALFAQQCRKSSHVPRKPSVTELGCHTSTSVAIVPLVTSGNQFVV
jgi:hypothetical protein